MYNVGDKVKFKTWGQLKKEYGEKYDTDLKAFIVFPHEAFSLREDKKYLCGKEHIITANKNIPDTDIWYYSTDGLAFFLEDIIEV